MGEPKTFDAEAVRCAVDALLAEYPDARLMALDSRGVGVPMPETFLLGQHRVLEGRGIIDFVVSEDLAVVARALYEMFDEGIAQTPVRLYMAPERKQVLHIADLKAADGIRLGIFVPGWVDDAAVATEDTARSRPRYATLRQNYVGGVLECDEALTLMCGWTKYDLAGKPSVDLIHPEDQARAIEGWMSMMATRSAHQMRCRYHTKDGKWIWVDVTMHNYLGQIDRDYVLVEMIDVSCEMAAQDALAAREQLLDRLAEALPVGVFQIDADRRVVYMNERLIQILGIGGAENLEELAATVTVEHRPRLEAALAAVLTNHAGLDVQVDLSLAETGERRSCLVSSRPLNDPDGAVTGAIVCVADITESARMHSELEDKATFDVLTRCYNRGAIMAAIDQVLVDEAPGRTGVIFVDLDNFKSVNDIFGHAAGDELLVSVAGRLTGAMRGEDIVGRIGGDEFLVVCRHIDSPDDALAVAQRITDSLAADFILTSGPIELRASIGVACSSGAMIADSLVAHADKAMYQSKRQGEGRPVAYSPALADGPAEADGDTSRRRVTRRWPRPLAGAKIPRETPEKH